MTWKTNRRARGEGEILKVKLSSAPSESTDPRPQRTAPCDCGALVHQVVVELRNHWLRGPANQKAFEVSIAGRPCAATWLRVCPDPCGSAGLESSPQSKGGRCGHMPGLQAPPCQGTFERQPTDVLSCSYPSLSFSLPSPLSKNKSTKSLIK